MFAQINGRDLENTWATLLEGRVTEACGREDLAGIDVVVDGLAYQVKSSLDGAIKWCRHSLAIRFRNRRPMRSWTALIVGDPPTGVDKDAVLRACREHGAYVAPSIPGASQLQAQIGEVREQCLR